MIFHSYSYSRLTLDKKEVTVLFAVIILALSQLRGISDVISRLMENSNWKLNSKDSKILLAQGLLTKFLVRNIFYLTKIITDTIVCGVQREKKLFFHEIFKGASSMVSLTSFTFLLLRNRKQDYENGEETFFEDIFFHKISSYPEVDARGGKVFR